MKKLIQSGLYFKDCTDISKVQVVGTGESSKNINAFI
jgi:hypothetical protein